MLILTLTLCLFGILLSWFAIKAFKENTLLQRNEELDKSCPVIRMFDKGYLEKLFEEKEIELGKEFIETSCWASFKIAGIPFETRSNYDGGFRIVLDNIYVQSPSLRKLIMTKFNAAVENHNNAYLKELGKEILKKAKNEQ